MNKLWIITKEVYKKNVKSFGFISLVFAPILFLAVIFLIGYFVGSSFEDTNAASVPEMAVVSNGNSAVEFFEQHPIALEINGEFSTEGEARQALGSEEIDAYLTVSLAENTVRARLVHDNQLTESIPLINDVLTGLQSSLRGQEAGLSPEQTALLTEPAELEEELVSVDDGEVVRSADGLSDALIRQGAAYIVNIGIFIFIMSYASIIAEEVANEKGSRIMEIILSSATATQHFFGKILGVILVFLTQVAIYAVIGAGAFFYFRNHRFIQEIGAVVDFQALFVELMGISLIYFILGLLMYIILAAFLGSLVTKTADVNKSVTPIVFLALIGFYAGLLAFAAPGQTVYTVLSHIPVFTPFVMPFRIAAETVGIAEIIISIGTSVLTIIILGLVSLAFYKSNVLVYSDTNIFGTIKKSWSIMKSNKEASN